MQDGGFPWHWYLLIVAGIIVVSIAARWLFRRSENVLDKMSMEQAEFLQGLPERWVASIKSERGAKV